MASSWYPQRPALTWHDVTDWARQNHVPGGAVVVDQNDRPLRLDHVAAERLVLAYSPAGPVTWAALQVQAADAGVTGEHRVTQLDGGSVYRIVDVGDWPAEPEAGQPAHVFKLQRRYG